MPTTPPPSHNASFTASPLRGAWKAPACEAAAWAVGVGALIYRLRVLLFSGTTTLTHDNINVEYPIFRHFVDGLSRGSAPFWNPYSAGGQPIFPIEAHFRLFDPVAMAAMAVGSLFTRDTVLLFNWLRLAQSLVMAGGAYLVLRRFCRSWSLRFCLIPPLLLSSFMLGSFRQDGRLEQLVWVPYMMHFLLKIVYYREDGWPSWLMLSAVTGLNWLCYFFAGVWMFFGFFAAGLLAFRRDLLARLWRRDSIAKAVVFLAVQACMLVPAFAIYRMSSGYVYPLRMLDPAARTGRPVGGAQPHEGGPDAVLPSIFLDYSVIKQMGSFSKPVDFLQLPAPGYEGLDSFAWDNSHSEAFMYLGALTWALALFGFFAGADGLKRVWLAAAVLTGLVMLGPAGGAHRLLFAVFPPLWLVRHTHIFACFFEFCLLYFFVLGLNAVVSRLEAA